MSSRQEEFNTIIWRLVREIAFVFLAGVAGWGLTAFLVLCTAEGLVRWPVWARVSLGMGSPILGGVFTGWLWWRWGRPAAGIIATRLSAYRLDPLARMPEGAGCFFLVCIGMTLMGILPMWHGLCEFTHHRWLGSFRPAEAVVTGARVDEVEIGNRKGLAPRVLYEFRVGDKLHAGYKIHWELQLPGPPEASGDPPTENVIWKRDESARETLNRLLVRYPAGKRVTAYYDPTDPSNACLVHVPFVWTAHGVGLWFHLSLLFLLWTIWLIVLGVSCRAAHRLHQGPSHGRISRGSP